VVLEHEQLLTGILRGEWGFTGFVLTDWYGVASTVGSQTAGVDLEMPGRDGPTCRPGRRRGPRRRGPVALESRWEGCWRSTSGSTSRRERPPDRRGPEAGRRATVARSAAVASIVLLKNDGILPLSADTGRLALVGPTPTRPS